MILNQCRYYLAFVAYAGCNVSLAICAGVLCAYIAPAAAGSGIPEVKAYLNGVDAHSILAPSTLFVKVCTSHQLTLFPLTLVVHNMRENTCGPCLQLWMFYWTGRIFQCIYFSSWIWIIWVNSTSFTAIF